MHSVSLLASFLSLTSALTINPRSPSQAQVPTQGHTVHQFPNGTWAENIAVRTNGDLLVTIVTSPLLYLISPLTSSQNPASPQTATLIHNFSPFAAVLGITSTHPDQFYAIVGNLSLSPLNAALGSYTVWSISLTSYNLLTNTGASIHQLAALPSAGLLNGLSTLSTAQNLLVLADSIYGAIWLLNTQTGASSILLQEPEMLPPPGATLGINGVRVLPGKKGDDTVYIYFSNTGSETLYRVPVSVSRLEKVGPVETLVTGFAVDDFALDEETGKAYLAGGSVNELLKVGLEGGEVEVVYGGVNETGLVAPTSVAVGRGPGEEGVLFVTTQKGRVVAVDVGC
ncbi:hypothetical protein N431DRAFT_433016 [Stipitochalara longipes BDJ]|nr:hypothetical protein N431DRAFT_433016 [Stipitochalara longipes BDJ]